MDFDENNNSPIPPFSRVTLQHINPRPTSTPKPTEEIHLNISDRTHNRGKVKRVNSFDTTQEQMVTEAKQSKGGPVKRSDSRGHPQPGTNIQGESHRLQIICAACRRHDHPEKTVMRMFSAIDAEPDPMLQRCAKFQHNQLQVIPFVYIVVA